MTETWLALATVVVVLLWVWAPWEAWLEKRERARWAEIAGSDLYRAEIDREDRELDGIVARRRIGRLP